MKQMNFTFTYLLLLLIAIPLFCLTAFVLKKQTDPGFILEHKNDIKHNEAGTHNGGGSTTAFQFL